MRKLLYGFGQWLCARFGDSTPQDRQAEIIANLVLERLMHPVVAPLAPNTVEIVPPAPERIEQSVPRIVAEIAGDGPATALSIFDRSVKALARLRHDIELPTLRGLVIDEMRRLRVD